MTLGQRRSRLLVLVTALFIAASPAFSQGQAGDRVSSWQVTSFRPEDAAREESNTEGPPAAPRELPDAPGPALGNAPEGAWETAAGPFTRTAYSNPPVAGRYKKKIEPGQRAQVLTGGDKVLIGLRGIWSPFSAIGWVASASYEQGIDGTPNYPQTTGGYFKRLGAISARNASSGVLGDGVLAPILRQDIRYYRLGPGRSFFYRFRYAATRQVIGRRDDGRPVFNAAEIGGNFSSALLTNAYFPRGNRGVAETAKTFGGLVGGGALAYTLVEFFADSLGRVF